MENKLSKFIPKKKEWMILLLVGVLLVVIALPTKTDSTMIETNVVNKDEMETKLEETLEKMKNVGKTHVMITYQEDDAVEGIVVLADGAKNAVVVREITEVVQALFDVDSHKIKVIESIQNN